MTAPVHLLFRSQALPSPNAWRGSHVVFDMAATLQRSIWAGNADAMKPISFSIPNVVDDYQFQMTATDAAAAAAAGDDDGCVSSHIWLRFAGDDRRPTVR